MKRSNGSGSVYKLSGKRRKSWGARVTTGYDPETGKQLYRLIGTFETKKDAMTALDHHLYGPDRSQMTVKESWIGWKDQATVRLSTLKAYESGFKRISKIHNVKLSDLTLDQMQSACDTEPRSYATVAMAKKVLKVCLDYGFAHDACPASRVELVKYIKAPARSKTTKACAWTDDEIFDAIDQHWIGPVILIFTGLRLDELMSLKRDDIDLESQIIHVRKSKTKAGIRDVPIPNAIIDYCKEYIESDGLGHTRRYFENHFWPDTSHTRHDCRHTYISILTAKGIDERLIKALVGHAGGVTSDIYTHWTNKRMIETVNNAFDFYFSNANSNANQNELLRA